MKKYILSAVIILIILAGLSFVYLVPKEKEAIPVKSTTQSIAELFSKKYSRSTDTIIIKTEFDTSAFAKGTVNFTGEPGGGVWFAAKTANGWELAFDGNGIAPCDAAEKYNFPKNIIPKCINTQNGNELIER